MAAAKRRASGGLGLGAYAAFRAALLQYQRGLRETTKVAVRVMRLDAIDATRVSSVAAMAYGDPRRRTRPRAASALHATSPSSTDRLASDGVGREPSQRGAFYRIRGRRVSYDAKAPRRFFKSQPRAEPARRRRSWPVGFGEDDRGAVVIAAARPGGGRVLVDGDERPHARAPPADRVVPQEPRRSTEASAENVAYGMEPAPPIEAIEAACVKAGVNNAISKLPEAT